MSNERIDIVMDTLNRMNRGTATLTDAIKDIYGLSISMNKEDSFKQQLSDMALEEKLLNVPSPNLDKTVNQIIGNVNTVEMTTGMVR